MSLMLRDPELAWRKPTATAIEVGKKFAKLGVLQFMGTVEHYEGFRDTFALLRHDWELCLSYFPQFMFLSVHYQ